MRQVLLPQRPEVLQGSLLRNGPRLLRRPYVLPGKHVLLRRTLLPQFSRKVLWRLMLRRRTFLL
jgi:hypothetical protein